MGFSPSRDWPNFEHLPSSGPDHHLIAPQHLSQPASSHLPPSVTSFRFLVKAYNAVTMAGFPAGILSHKAPRSPPSVRRSDLHLPSLLNPSYHSSTYISSCISSTFPYYPSYPSTILSPDTHHVRYQQASRGGWRGRSGNYDRPLRRLWRYSLRACLSLV